MLNGWLYIQIGAVLAIGHITNQFVFSDTSTIEDESRDEIDEMLREANCIIGRVNRGESFALFDNQNSVIERDML